MMILLEVSPCGRTSPYWNFPARTGRSWLIFQILRQKVAENYTNNQRKTNNNQCIVDCQESESFYDCFVGFRV
jgi:hypothetical protein